MQNGQHTLVVKSIILRSYPVQRCPDAVRSIEAPRIHHAALAGRQQARSLRAPSSLVQRRIVLRSFTPRYLLLTLLKEAAIRTTQRFSKNCVGSGMSRDRIYPWHVTLRRGGRIAAPSSRMTWCVQIRISIVAAASRLVLSLKAATDTIPIVAVMADPVPFGIVASIARPGGNITGVSVEAGLDIWGKRLQVLREAIPTASKVGFLGSHQIWNLPQDDCVAGNYSAVAHLSAWPTYRKSDR